MSVSIHWIEEPWILAVNFSEYITVDDIRTAIAACVPLLSEHPVYFLIDMSTVSGFDPQIFELSSLSVWIYHPNGRWFAYIRPAHTFTSLMKRRQRGNFRAFDDYNEALDFLLNSSRLERLRAKLF